MNLNEAIENHSVVVIISNLLTNYLIVLIFF